MIDFQIDGVSRLSITYGGHVEQNFGPPWDNDPLDDGTLETQERAWNRWFDDKSRREMRPRRRS